MADVPIAIARGPLPPTPRVPPSKSVQQRALVLACLADGESEIVADGAPSRDAETLARALTTLCGRDVPAAGRVVGALTPEGLGTGRRSMRLDLADNGTGFRLLCAVSGLRPDGARTLLTGTPRLRARPHAPLLRALARLCGRARPRSSGAVRVIGGGLRGGRVAIDAGVSSQFATALVLVAPRLGGLSLSLVGAPVSGAYLRLTRAVCAEFGVRVEVEGSRVVVAAGAVSATRLHVPPDASSAAAWFAAAALVGGRVEVEGLREDDAQPDLAILPVLERMGASVQRRATSVRVVGNGPLRAPGDVDLRDAPDLAPLVAALAAAAPGTTRVVGAPHLRHKESDRVATVVAALRAVGVEASERADGFEVLGGAPRGGLVRVEGDHRIALAFGVLGLAVEGVVLRGAGAVEKSYPGFLDRLADAARGAA